MTAAARAERDRGIAAALERPAADWDRRVVDRAIWELARTGRQFSANDVRPLLPVVSPSIVGARFLAAAKAGLIERIGDVQATHAAGHSRRVALWQGTGTPRPNPTRARRQRPAERPATVDRTSPGHVHRSGPMSGHEPVTEKAARLLAAGKVRVRLADADGRVVAEVRGDSGTYAVRRTARGRWSCPCVAGRYGRPCGHVAAVALVVP